MSSQMKDKKLPYHLIGIFLLLSISIWVAGYFYYQHQKEYIKKDKQETLAAIADLKVNQIVNWRKERLGDAKVIFENQLIKPYVQEILKRPDSIMYKKEILDWMRSTKRYYIYQNVILLDTQGNMRLAVTDGKEVLGTDAKRLASEAIKTKQIVFSDLYRGKITNVIRLTLVVPLIVSKGSETIPIGSILLRIDPNHFLYSLMQTWPTPSDTAESILVRREGNNVIFLNELRHRKGTELSMHTTIDDRDCPAAMAAQGITGVVEGIDYRGVPVLAAIRAIPDSPWFLVSKVDIEEIYAPIREHFWIVTIVVSLLIVGSGIGIGLFWRHQSAEFYRQQYEAESERLTERKKAEEEIRKLNEELEQRVIQRTAQLEAANKELENEIIERKKIEKAMRKAEGRYHILFEQSPDGVVLIDPETTLPIEFNETAHQRLGYSHEEFARQRVSDYEAVEKSEETKARIDKILHEGRDDFETKHRTKDGAIRDVFVTVQLLDLYGKPVLHCIFRDITELKRVEEEIMRLNVDLQRQALKLEAINKELEAFSYSVSHDLQSPLRSIDGFGQALLEDYYDKLDEEGRNYLQRIRKASQHMGKLIDDLLNLSKVTRYEMQYAEVDLSTLVKEIAGELQKNQPERHVESVIQDEVIVHGDARLLRIMIENLLNNAFKFTEKNPQAKIEFGTTQYEGKTVCFVRDNGAGFDMAYADKLFNPFQRLHSQNEFSGTGIGLAIVQRIIRRHGGYVWAEGKINEGATFYFRI